MQSDIARVRVSLYPTTDLKAPTSLHRSLGVRRSVLPQTSLPSEQPSREDLSIPHDSRSDRFHIRTSSKYLREPFVFLTLLAEQSLVILPVRK